MDSDIIVKLVLGEPITDGILADILYSICDEVHANCDNECPIYDLNVGIPWNKDENNCVCFKAGFDMLDFIRNHKDTSRLT